MNIYRIISNSCLHEFQDPIGEVPILGKSLDSWQKEYIQKAGLKLIDVKHKSDIQDESYLVFTDDCYFSEAFLLKAINTSKKASHSLLFALKKNSFNERFILPFQKQMMDDYRFNFHYIHSDKSPIEVHYIDQLLYDFDVRMPDQLMKGAVYSVPQCDTIAAHIISPFHLLQVNMAENLKRTIKVQKGKFLAYFKDMKGWLGVRLFHGALKRLNKIGKNSFIHPSAIIEGCVIGDNVRVGAGAVLRLCTIGDDVTISENVVVANSVLGNKTFISNSNYIEMVMTYEEAFLIHGPYQLSIYGRKSAAFAVINCDFRLDQESIKIPTSKGILDSQQPFLGIAYGHGAKVGGGNIIAGGRIVPNGRIVNPPDNIILKF